jgi:hypothetical protein
MSRDVFALVIDPLAQKLDEEALAKVISQAIQHTLVNRTVTLDPENLLHFLGIGSTLPKLPFSSPLKGNGNMTFDLGSIPAEKIDEIVTKYLDQHWGSILDRFGPEHVSIECTVVDGVDDPAGKWPQSLGNVAVLEAKYIMRSLSNLLPKTWLRKILSHKFWG